MSVTRRKFIKTIAGISAWVAAAPTAAYGGVLDKVLNLIDPKPAPLPAATVVIGKDKRWEAGEISEAGIREKIDQGVMQLTGKDKRIEAWKSLFSPDDVVGIKVNCIAGRALSSHLEIVHALAESLQEIGVRANHIIVWDRLNSDLEKAGYPIVTSDRKVQYYGNDYHGYARSLEMMGSVGSLFCKILSEKCSAIINVPILKDHDLAGVTIAMKNFYGAIHNPNKYHDNNCDPYIAELNTSPIIRKKTRLIVCDALLAQYNGGPAFKPQYTWQYGGILVGRDPVALDRIGWDIIEKKRLEKKLPTLKEAKREPAYIRTAAKLGLGEGDIKKVKVVNL
jgi:uncharacterized protein (DUF362 family)